MTSAEPVANPECLVCVKHARADPAITIERTDTVDVSHHPLTATTYRGHLFVEPHRHVVGLGDLSDDEAAEVGRVMTRAARALRSIGAEHVYSAVYGNRVPHLHVHLLPRWPGTPTEYWGPHVTDWPAAPRVDREELVRIVGALRNAW